jgi:hypothetical protein
MSNDDSFFNKALGIAILTTLIMLTITSIAQPVIACFLDKLKRIFCPCVYHDEDETPLVVNQEEPNNNNPDIQTKEEPEQPNP